MEQHVVVFCLGINHAMPAPVLPDGHFSYWAEQNMPVFKHSILLNEDEGDVFEGKLRQVIDIAIKECERMYPVFKVVLTKGMNPRQALYPMMMETVGQA